MRSVTSELRFPEVFPAPFPRSPPPGPVPLVFPLPGGRNVVPYGWVPPGAGQEPGSDPAGLPESTAERRRRVARRRSLGGPGSGATPSSNDVPLNPAEAATAPYPFGSAPRSAPESPPDPTGEERPADE